MSVFCNTPTGKGANKIPPFTREQIIIMETKSSSNITCPASKLIRSLTHCDSLMIFSPQEHLDPRLDAIVNDYFSESVSKESTTARTSLEPLVENYSSFQATTESNFCFCCCFRGSDAKAGLSVWDMWAA